MAKMIVSHSNPQVKLTALRLDILKLCCTLDDRGHTGIASWYVPHLKPATKRTVNYLKKLNLIQLDMFGALVATPEGYDLYESMVDDD
jgi:hypothetical protein